MINYRSELTKKAAILHGRNDDVSASGYSLSLSLSWETIFDPAPHQSGSECCNACDTDDVRESYCRLYYISILINEYPRVNNRYLIYACQSVHHASLGAVVQQFPNTSKFCSSKQRKIHYTCFSFNSNISGTRGRLFVRSKLQCD